MNFDSVALSKLDPAKAACFGPFLDASGISMVSLAISARMSLLRHCRPRTARPCEPACRPAVVDPIDDAQSDRRRTLSKPPCLSITTVHIDDHRMLPAMACFAMTNFGAQGGGPYSGCPCSSYQGLCGPRRLLAVLSPMTSRQTRPASRTRSGPAPRSASRRPCDKVSAPCGCPSPQADRSLPTTVHA